MTFTPDFCAANIRIDKENDFVLWSDTMNVSYPLRFPIVNIPLRDMSGLYEIADKIRTDLGYLPMMPPCADADDESYDPDGWYNFSVDIIRLPDGDMLGRCITFTVDSHSADDGEEYTIDLDDAERKTIYARLDELARDVYGKSCAELLDESQAELLDEETHKPPLHKVAVAESDCGIASPSPAPDGTNILIYVSGGLVQSVVTNAPNAHVTVYDADTEEFDEAAEAEYYRIAESPEYRTIY